MKKIKEKYALFITGIGTDVGKTIISSIITEALQADYWKPIQAGGIDNQTDCHVVKKLVSNSKSIFFSSKYNLATPASPHLAAKLDKIKIKSSELKLPYTKNHLVVEGAGGLLVPINNKQTIADLIKKKYFIVLVSRHYLGSINHTLLSLFYLKSMGFKKIGILFNGKENKETETIIKKLGNTFIIGRIELLNELSKENISIEAKRIKPHLLKFLKTN